MSAPSSGNTATPTLAVMIGTEAIVYSPVGDAIYAWVTAGMPGASVAPLEFGPMPPIG